MAVAQGQCDFYLSLLPTDFNFSLQFLITIHKDIITDVLDAQTQNGDEPVGEISYPRAKLPF